MRVAEIIRRRLRSRSEGVDFAGDVNAVIAANVGERGASTRVSSEQRIVQRSGRTTKPDNEKPREVDSG
jgi:hypothetical protein